MNKSTKQGFTIIEVVLVLAIAALIFLMAFVAFPALQRSQRDTARKNAVSTVVSAVNDYSSNNRGALSGLSDISGYVTELIAAGFNISVAADTLTTITDALDTITIFKNKKCPVNSTSNTVLAGTTRDFIVATKLESGAFFCQEG